jgi:hypothetical protein
MQPVAAIADNYWTDDVNQCIKWFLSPEIRRLYEARLPPKRRKSVMRPDELQMQFDQFNKCGDDL